MATEAVHRINDHEFEFWEGDAPTQIKQQVARFTRAGVDDPSHKLLGKRGEPFTCQLTSWHETREDARDALHEYAELIGADAVEIRKDDEDLLETEQVRFLVLNVVEVQCKTNVRLFSSAREIDYPEGVALVTSWTLCPIVAREPEGDE